MKRYSIKIPGVIVAFFLCCSPLIAQEVDSCADSVDTSKIIDKIDTVDTVDTSVAIDSLIVSIDGIIIDSSSGDIPEDSTLHLMIDSLSVLPDSNGEFSINVKKKSYYSITVISDVYARIDKTVTVSDDKRHLFVTLSLQQKIQIHMSVF